MAADERMLRNMIKDLYDKKKSGALYVSVVETSEDLIRIYFKKGEIYYLSYGSAIGQDAMEIIEYYTLQNATFFEGLAAPEGTTASKFPTQKFIAMLEKTMKKVRVP